jgi:hypothetical protein
MTFVGTVTIGGQTIGIDTVALWITRLEEIAGWVNPWIPTVNTIEPSRDVRDFSASVDLTSDALTPRGRAAGVPDAG